MHCSQGKTDRQGRKRRQASEKMEVAKAMNYMDQYKFWLEDSYFDEGTKEELRKIADNQAEIEDRFYKDLAFGTGGLRGVIGAGTNRMNVYVVRQATQGLANWVKTQAAPRPLLSAMTAASRAMCLPRLLPKFWPPTA